MMMMMMMMTEYLSVVCGYLALAWFRIGKVAGVMSDNEGRENDTSFRY